MEKMSILSEDSRVLQCPLLIVYNVLLSLKEHYLSQLFSGTRKICVQKCSFVFNTPMGLHLCQVDKRNVLDVCFVLTKQ